MNTLSEEKYLLVKQYVDLLETIDVAFGHIISSFENLNFKDADTLLNDVYLAFSQITSSNAIIAEHFTESPSVLNDFVQFEDVIEKADLLEHADRITSEILIREKLYPAFSTWYLKINEDLKRYYVV